MATIQTRFNDFDQPKTFYEILGIEPDASPKKIKDAYLNLAKLYHPDHNHNDNDRRMIELNLVYDVLSHPDKKKEYDEKFASATLYDFSHRRSKSTPAQQKVDPKTEIVYKTRLNYLKVLRLMLTTTLMVIISYLAFYLIVKVLQFYISIPDCILNLIPK